MVALVDSRVLLHVATDDPTWVAWSAEALAAAIDRGPVCVNPIVYAEISVRFERIEELDAFLSSTTFVREPFPDFYIGAHAAVRGQRLLTRDARGHRTSFPSVELDSPGSTLCPVHHITGRLAPPWHAPRCVGIAGKTRGMTARRRLAMPAP